MRGIIFFAIAAFLVIAFCLLIIVNLASKIPTGIPAKPQTNEASR